MENKILKIKKRNGEIVDFNQEKITNAVFKAITATKQGNGKKTKKISDKIVEILNRRFKKEEIPDVEQIQDIVEEVLILEGEVEAAKAFILYREQRRRIREAQAISEEAVDRVDDYLDKMDWEVQENSNMTFSLQGLNHYGVSYIVKKYWLNKIYPKEIREANESGDLHLHNLDTLACYCVGWDLYDLLSRGFGGVPGKTESFPPKHLRSALGQVVNFMYTLQGEAAGAVSFSNFDTLLAPFIRYDNLSYVQVEQAMQEFLYNMAVPTRVGFQCLSEDTEILTSQGWKKYDEIDVGQTIKTYNLKTGELEDKNVLKMFTREYQGIMYNLKGETQDQLISPEHRIVKKDSKNNSFVLEPIEEVLKQESSFIIPAVEINEQIRIKETQIFSVEKVEYRGIIWCPTTENETVVAKRKDKIFITGNCPFTNITLDLRPSPVFANQPVIIGGVPQKQNYGEFGEEMKVLVKAFYAAMLKGDKSGRPFSFPIPTINITHDFPWDDPAFDGLFEASAKYGINYFANYLNSDMRPEDVRSMCCRLRLNLNELANRGGGGLFGSGALTGSIGVVTINLPRIGYLSKTKKEFFERLMAAMDIAKESLEIKRKTIENFTVKGLYPYSRYYLSGVKKAKGQYFANHFSTIGLIGMNEALLNFLGEDIGTKRGRQFSLEVMDLMRERLVNYQKETGNIYNLEATPAESTAYRLAQKDRGLYPDIITAGTKKVPYYTNSTQLPVNYTDDIFETLKLQDELQCKYTGGTVQHLFLGEEISDIETVKNLIKKIFEKNRLPYITFTPTFSICPIHGYVSGKHFTCPKCTIEQPCEVYSRVVGYLRPVSQWNEGKQQEFKERKEFNIKSFLAKTAKN